MNKTYAFSDIHGTYALWEHISKFLDSTDTVYFLGDSIDRGTENLKTIFSLLNDKRVIFLRGNHEDNMLRAFEYILKTGNPDISIDMNNIDIQTWLCNGGNATLDEIISQNISTEDLRFLIHKIKKMPYEKEYINKNGQTIHLSHAGKTYGSTTVKVKGKEYMAQDDDLLWDREHFFDAWNPIYEKVISVHGHTPIECLAIEMKQNLKLSSDSSENIEKLHYINKLLKDPTEILTYCGGHKINIDLGAFFYKKTALLDLDTLEPIYFTEKGKI